MTDPEIVDAIFRLLHARARSASVCPSEVARVLVGGQDGWRALMPEVRRVAAGLAAHGELRVTQGTATVDALSANGPVRLRRID